MFVSVGFEALDFTGAAATISAKVNLRFDLSRVLSLSSLDLFGSVCCRFASLASDAIEGERPRLRVFTFALFKSIDGGTELEFEFEFIVSICGVEV